MCLLRLRHRKESTVSLKNSDKQSVLIPPLKKKFPGNITAASEERNNNPYYIFNPKKMKKIFTLCTIMVLSLFAIPASAQINENFENGLAPLAANCWQFTNMMYATNPAGYVIQGNGSPYSEPPVSSDSVRIIRTPFLWVENTIDVSFLYKLSANLTGMAKRFIKIDLVNPSGNIVQTLDSFNVTNAATTSTLYNQTLPVTVPGAYRLSITMGGSTGGGTVRLSMDDLTTNAYLSGCIASLPVHLISYQGNLNKNNKVTLNWTIADNETAKTFEIERSFNGRDFAAAAVVFASEKMGTETYTYYETVNANDKVMYRLKMIDKNHEADYSKILIFQLKSTITNNIKIIGNPVNDKLTFSYTAPVTQVIDVKVYDMTGRVVLNNKVSTLEGSNMISLPLSSTFKVGMYVVEVNNGTELQSSKFVKQ